MGTDDSPRPGFDQWVSFPGQGRYDNPPLNINGKRVQTEGYMTDLLSGHAVDGTNEGTSATTDHAHAEFTVHE